MNGLSLAVSLILIAVFIGSVLDGRKKGFVRITLSLLSTIICGFVAAAFADPVAAYIAENFVHESFVSGVSLALTNAISNGSKNLAEALPEYIVTAVNNFDAGLLSDISTSVNTAELAEKIYTAIESTVIIGILYLIAFFVIFAVCSFVLKFVVSAIDKVFRLPVLKNLNKMLGTLVGGIKGLVVLAIISVSLYLIAAIFPETQFAVAVNGSSVQRVIFETVSMMF